MRLACCPRVRWRWTASSQLLRFSVASMTHTPDDPCRYLQPSESPFSKVAALKPRLRSERLPPGRFSPIKSSQTSPLAADVNAGRSSFGSVPLYGQSSAGFVAADAGLVGEHAPQGKPDASSLSQDATFTSLLPSFSATGASKVLGSLRPVRIGARTSSRLRQLTPAGAVRALGPKLPTTGASFIVRPSRPDTRCHTLTRSAPFRTLAHELPLSVLTKF